MIKKKVGERERYAYTKQCFAIYQHIGQTKLHCCNLTSDYTSYIRCHDYILGTDVVILLLVTYNL